MRRYVMTKGTWPEGNDEDFVVFEINEGENEETMLEIAKEFYGEEKEFYIKLEE